MNKIIAIAIALLAPTVATAQDWKPAGEKLLSRFAKDVSPTNVHPEYPRPQMVRARWQNLNGLWDYALRPATEVAGFTAAADGKILVPFPIESALSGVGKTVAKDQALWYRRLFAVPADWRTNGQRVLLHFGAVDWKTDVYVNDKLAGSHTGGYDPFSFDITEHLKAEGEQSLARSEMPPIGRCESRFPARRSGRRRRRHFIALASR